MGMSNLLTLKSTVASEATLSDGSRSVRTSRRTRVLAITSELPWPLNTGGHIRTFHLLRSLAEQFNVRLLTVVECGDVEHLEHLRSVGIDVRAAVVGPRRPWTEAARVAAAAMRREPYVLYCRHDRGELRRLVRDELARETPDVVYFDHLDPFVFHVMPQGFVQAAWKLSHPRSDVANPLTPATLHAARRSRWVHAHGADAAPALAIPARSLP